MLASADKVIKYFRLLIEEKYMHKTSLKLFLNSCSDNRQSKIENRK
jgi:hypothetical protein